MLTRGQRVALVKAAHRGPRRLGRNADVWAYKDLWLYAKKKFGTTTICPAAVRRFHETGIVFKTPRPKHPDAASEEERAEYWRDARKAIPRYARRGYAVVSMDEAHLYSYKNMLKTLGLRGIETSADSSVERARLSVFGGVGALFLPQ